VNRVAAVRKAAAAGLVLVLAACGTTRVFLPSPGPYDVLPEEAVARARDARRYLENGNLRRAHELLVELSDAHPQHVPLAILLQDSRLALLEAGRAATGVVLPEEPLDPEEARAVLRDWYAGRAATLGRPVDHLLAARLAPTPGDVLAALEPIEALDPDCVWLHYARAHASFRLRDFPAVRKSLAAALEQDSAHLPTLRLEATLLSEATDVPDALAVLGYWLETTQDDPFVDPRTFASAQVDLAQLLVVDGEEGEAQATLDAIDTRFLASDRERARAKLVRAAALEGRNNLPAALGAAREAARLDPNDLLALVDQAYLLGRMFGLESEREVWEKVLEVAAVERERLAQLSAEERAEEMEFLDLLHELQARTRLARIEEVAGTRGEEGARP